MAKTLTLKNLLAYTPCLEAGLGVAVPSAEEELTRIRLLRGSLGPHVFDPDAINALKREGRP